MNSRTRRAALYASGVVALLASIDALAHSYTGLYGWAVHHRLGGWQALSWPAEIDVFLLVGELALYVAYLDAWPVRQRLWPWLTAVTGLIVSMAGNVGHIQPLPDAPVTLADRLTAAASPVAAFAGLMIGLLVLKMSRERQPCQVHADAGAEDAESPSHRPGTQPQERTPLMVLPIEDPAYMVGDARLLRDAMLIFEESHTSGQRVSQRALAAKLRERGHRFSNAQLRDIATAAGSAPDTRAA